MRSGKVSRWEVRSSRWPPWTPGRYTRNWIDEETKLTNIQVRKEIFASEQKKEIRDEIIFPFSIRVNQSWSGLFTIWTLGGRVGLEFKIGGWSSPANRYTTLQNRRSAEADETTDVVFSTSATATIWTQVCISRLTPHALRRSLRFLAQISKTSRKKVFPQNITQALHFLRREHLLEHFQEQFLKQLYIRIPKHLFNSHALTLQRIISKNQVSQ